MLLSGVVHTKPQGVWTGTISCWSARPAPARRCWRGACPGLLPEPERDETLEVTQVLSAAGLLRPDAPLATARPFRAPHHATSVAGLIGGGSPIPRSGQISLAQARLHESP